MQEKIYTIEHFRKWVKKQLVEREISQNKLALEMGIPHARISEAIHGKQSGDKYILAIIKELGGDTEDFEIPKREAKRKITRRKGR